MADENNDIDFEEQGEKRGAFRRYFYRGYEVDALLDLSQAELLKLFHARARRRFNRGLKPSHIHFIKRLRKAKKAAAENGGKPEPVKTHLRNMIILPEMVASVIGVHNGSQYAAVEVRPDMIGHYLGEFSMTYKPVTHNRPGMGSTASAKFIPLK